MAFIVFIPIFAIYNKKAIPYFIALIQHSLIGDYSGRNGPQLLWPFASQSYGIALDITSLTSIAIEWSMFLVAMIVLIKSKDVTKFFQPNKSNLILAIPTFTVLMPTVLGFPLNVPAWLIPPHLAYLLLFSAAIIIALSSISKSSFHAKNCL